MANIYDQQFKDHLTMHMMVCDGVSADYLHRIRRFLETALAELKELRAGIQAAEIHNRFCGENGEPCQVCRLKAEREAK